MLEAQPLEGLFAVHEQPVVKSISNTKGDTSSSKSTNFNPSAVDEVMASTLEWAEFTVNRELTTAPKTIVLDAESVDKIMATTFDWAEFASQK